MKKPDFSAKGSWEAHCAGLQWTPTIVYAATPRVPTSADVQKEMRAFLCERIGLVPTEHLRCLGRRIDGKLVAVVGFDNFNGAAVEMHVAASQPRWMNRTLLEASFDYPFNVLGAKTIIAKVPSGNKEALKLNKNLGFHEVANMKGAHPDGSLVIQELPRAKCRFLKKR